MIHTSFDDIDKAQWRALIETSPVATWFQTEEAYRFYASLPEIMTPFVIAVSEDVRIKEQGLKGREQRTINNDANDLYLESLSTNQDYLVGVIVGYITKEKNPIKQYFSRRAIIISGPLLSQDISQKALTELLTVLKQTIAQQAIYIETRNFNDYSHWKPIFTQCGFNYHPHNNFHVDTTNQEVIEANLGSSRKRDIRVSLRDGATIVEQPTLEQVNDYYTILSYFYAHKIHLPLFPLSFFQTLYTLPDAHFLLIEYHGKIIGGTVCVGLTDNTLYEWYACGLDGQFKNIFPSELATYAGMEYAANHHFPRFDMMGAGKPEDNYGVRNFKAHFGGTLVEHGRYMRISKPFLYKLGSCVIQLLKKLR